MLFHCNIGLYERALMLRYTYCLSGFGDKFRTFTCEGKDRRAFLIAACVVVGDTTAERTQ